MPKSSAARPRLHELIGDKDNLGAALMSLVQLFLGKEPGAEDGERQGLILLTRRFAADDLPEARTAIAGRIIAEFKSFKRLCPKSLLDEFKTLRQIANLVVDGVGKYLSHEDLIAAFTLRSQRLINQVTLGEHLADAATPDEKLERLLFVEDNIIGAENKRRLAAFVVPIVAAASFESSFPFGFGSGTDPAATPGGAKRARAPLRFPGQAARGNRRPARRDRLRCRSTLQTVRIHRSQVGKPCRKGRHSACACSRPRRSPSRNWPPRRAR